MADNNATSFRVLNYAGMLFNKGNTRTPFSTMIGGRRKTTNHVEFVTGQEYTTGGGSQPSISEDASLTAPDADTITREQKTNVTQIFQESVKVSYGKMSNMGTLAGANVQGQSANPADEMAFQIAAKMNKIARDIEFTFMQGVYQKAANDQTANKSRGIMTAITSNVMNLDGKPLRVWDVAEAMKLIRDANGDISGLVLWLDAVSKFQLNADAEANGNTIVPAARNINGINVDTILTPLGEINMYLGEFLPAGSVGLFNMGVCAPVEQPTPGKGNFFLEELAKVGAGTKYQIFGQCGLDHGPEWFHSKITGIDTTFTKPQSGKHVYITTPVPTIDVDATLISATLDKSTVAATDGLKVAVASLSYDVKPGTDPSLTYVWQIRAKTGTTWTDLTSSYSGYNTSELTVKAADAEKHYRCKVVATGSANGTVYSDECTMAAAG